MADRVTISRYRSEIIENTINIEFLMNFIILQRYFKKPPKNFLFEVLYDEYFSFGLRRRILEKIIQEPDKEQLGNLRRINTIRNYFAHCNQEILDGPGPFSAEDVGRIPDPRHPEKGIDFEKLHREFKKIQGPLESYLGKVFTDMGGELFLEDDSTNQS